ncbi:Lipase 2 [Leucoagaricus sp. SymC.cos]|nr:Lipase 2 [Leucoagaricus sp. SymC.cos]
MDKLPGIPWNVSPSITRAPTLAAFRPLLEKNRPLITAVNKKTFKYGETDRHYLDIYYPPATSASTESTPILFFVYGGGFVSGARNFPPPLDLVYSCFGSFFARQGFIVIIPDYRLAPEYKYPSAIEDVLKAIQWSSSHASSLISETTPNPDPKSIFIMGHSAGAVHVATLVFHATLIPVESDLREKIKGIALVSGPFKYFQDTRDGVFEAHWGSAESARENSAISLLIKSFENLPKAKLPKILLVEAEFEPKWIMEMGLDYWRLLEWHLGEPVRMDVVKDHNHISLNCALSSGEGEEWGIRVAEWMKDVFSGGVPTKNTANLGILQDVEETDVYECTHCRQKRTRSFPIVLNTQTVRSKTFSM